jgi:ABC-type transport system involved in multi-copper enzyme maturation permease subunit
MTSVLLIAGNFVRENRWPLLTLLLYVLVFGGAMAFAGEASAEDILFFLRSVAVYGLAFSGLLAASAINNERRSRRILSVLSKAVERGQYLVALLAGVMAAAAIYCAAIGLVGTAALARHGAPVMKVWELVGVLLAGFLLVATAALFFSTFLHPLPAAAAAAVLLAATGAVGHALGPAWENLLPAYRLVASMLDFNLAGWQPPWLAAAWAVAHAAIFWTLATIVFSRRDIAVAVE